MQNKIENDIRFLKRYAIGTTIVCLFLFAFLFAGQLTGKQNLGEINVERINIVEPDGKLRMVISDKARQHPGIVNGKLIKRDYPRPPGMIFFNHLGDEMGGLVFDENGGNGHFGMLTFDKVRNDQAVGLRYLESDNGDYTTGIEIWQQPNIPADIVQAKYDSASNLNDTIAREAAIQKMRDNNELTTQRLFLGKWRNDKAALVLSDIKGNARIMLTVDADGEAKLEFLNEKGEVTYTLPEKK